MTNYLDPESFQKFILAIPNLKYFTNITKPYGFGPPRPPMSIKGFQVLYLITYFCALRISEALKLESQDINLERGIITIREAKTSKTRCKCSKWDYKDAHAKQRNVLVSADVNCKKCKGKGIYFRNQMTTIPKVIIPIVKEWMEGKYQLFKGTRQTIWKYGKEISEIADLDLYEPQIEREISGYWNHLLRKSFEKYMGKKQASRALRMLKLRHADKDAHDTYEKVDIPALIEWENENITTTITL